MADVAQIKQNKQDIDNIQFLKDAEGLYLDLGSSTLDRMNFVTKSMKEGNLNEAQMLALQELQQKRNTIFSFLTNLSRSVYDTMQGIIRNIGR